MTGGTFQEYDKHSARIFSPTAGFVKYNLQAEPAFDRVERGWAEEQLRAERRKNMRLGIAERLEVTLARVQAMHASLRVTAAAEEADAALADARARYEGELADAREWNATCEARTREEWDSASAGVRARNQARLDAAAAAYEGAHSAWEAAFADAHAAWQAEVADLEAQRTQAQAALKS
eukprot:58837-Chlamydomonas_euryale.AAC.1